MILAGIDIGTNALRLLIAETRLTQGRLKLRPIYQERRIVRLGEGLVNSGLLSPPAMTRTLLGLKEFHAVILHHPVERVIAVATSAVREAGNRRLFLDRVKEEVELEVEVLSGQEEARRTLLGVRYGLQGDDQDLLVMDIGGGSTEWMMVRDGKVQELKTAEIGVVKLVERYRIADPPSVEDLRCLINGIEEAIGPILKSVVRSFRTLPGHRFVGTAGTVTTLAAMELGMTPYDAARVQNMRLGFKQVEAWFQKLVGMTLSERRLLPGLEKGREDLIVAGTALLLTTMRWIGAKEVIVSDYGLREGVLMDWVERHGPI